MSDQDETSRPALPPEPYLTTWGPLDAPILRRDQPPALGVVTPDGPPTPLGIAFPVGQVAHRRGPAATFRLMVGKVELEGRWLCVGQRFVPLGDAAEEL